LLGTGGFGQALPQIPRWVRSPAVRAVDH